MNKKLKLTSVAMAISSAGVGSIAIAQQTYYQCMPCPTNYFAKPGAVGKDSCIHITSMKTSDFSNRYEAKAGASCVDGKVKQGYAYKVVLRGGDGGCDGDCTYKGGIGGYLEYNFFAHADGTVSLCAGSMGANGTSDKGAGGGGAGSYLKLNFGGTQDYYFVAGGGGGAGSWRSELNTTGGGGGGGIGAGGSGATGGNDGAQPGGIGGRVGPYNGGTANPSRIGGGYGGQGLVKGPDGATKTGGSGGGNGGAGSFRNSWGTNTTTTNVYTYGVNGPQEITNKIFGGTGGISANNGKNGTTSINSNVTASFSAHGQGYAYLYYIE